MVGTPAAPKPMWYLSQLQYLAAAPAACCFIGIQCPEVQPTRGLHVEARRRSNKMRSSY